MNEKADGGYISESAGQRILDHLRRNRNVCLVYPRQVGKRRIQNVWLLEKLIESQDLTDDE